MELPSKRLPDHSDDQDPSKSSKTSKNLAILNEIPLKVVSVDKLINK